MSIGGRFAAAAVVLVLLAAPTVPAQINNPDDSTQTTLYFHVFDTYNKFVVNTQAMDADFFEVGGSNFPTTTGTPLGDFDLNTIYGTSTAGPVEYDFIENGRPRFHPERGIAADVQIDPAVQPVAYLYLDVRDIFGTDGLPNVMPTFHLRVTMREGDDPGTDADLDSGDLIMEGETPFHIVDFSLYPGAFANDAFIFTYCVVFVCSAEDELGLPEDGSDANDIFAGQSGPDGNPILVPDEDGIIEVAIPMEIAQDVIPKSEAFNVRIDWFQTLGGVMEPDTFSEPYFRLAADQDHLPRLEMAITNPVYIEFIHPQVAAGTLLIHTGVNSPWGTYDIDAKNITLTVDGPSQPVNLDQVVAQNQHVHGLHDKAAEITYLWKFRDEQAADGQYVINMAVPNGAGTATALGTARFVVEGKEAFGEDTEGNVVEPTVSEDTNDSPAAGLLGALALLGAILITRRKNA